MLRSLSRLTTRATTPALPRQCLNASRVSHRAACTQPRAAFSFSSSLSKLPIATRALVSVISTSSAGQDKARDNHTGAVAALFAILTAASTSTALASPSDYPPLQSSETATPRRSARLSEAQQAKPTTALVSDNKRKKGSSCGDREPKKTRKETRTYRDRMNRKGKVKVRDQTGVLSRATRHDRIACLVGRAGLTRCITVLCVASAGQLRWVYHLSTLPCFLDAAQRKD